MKNGWDDMRERVRRMMRKAWLLGAALLLLLLSGCNPDGGPLVEVCYPSGYARTSATWDELVPMEGTDYQLRAQKAEDYDKTYDYDLQILDKAGDLLYEFPDVGRPTMRGESAEGGSAVWVCSERWDTIHCNGYLDGKLAGSIVLLVDMTDGAVLFQGEAGAGELYLTSAETRCYFYEAGEPERTGWFGLVRTPARNARIYYRDARDWENPQTVYTFDYIGQPDVASYPDSRLKIRFYLEEELVRVVWESTDRVLTDEGKYRAVFSEKAVYEVPIWERAPEQSSCAVPQCGIREAMPNSDRKRPGMK